MMRFCGSSTWSTKAGTKGIMRLPALPSCSWASTSKVCAPFAHLAQRQALAVDDLKADQVDPVILARRGRWKARPRHEDARAAQGLGGVAVIDVLRPGQHHAAMVLGLADGQ